MHVAPFVHGTWPRELTCSFTGLAPAARMRSPLPPDTGQRTARCPALPCPALPALGMAEPGAWMPTQLPVLLKLDSASAEVVEAPPSALGADAGLWVQLSTPLPALPAEATTGMPAAVSCSAASFSAEDLVPAGDRDRRAREQDRRASAHRQTPGSRAPAHPQVSAGLLLTWTLLSVQDSCRCLLLHHTTPLKASSSSRFPRKFLPHEPAMGLKRAHRPGSC